MIAIFVMVYTILVVIHVDIATVHDVHSRISYLFYKEKGSATFVVSIHLCV